MEAFEREAAKVVDGAGAETVVRDLTIRQHEIELENANARNQALFGEGETFDRIEKLMADLHA